MAWFLRNGDFNDYSGDGETEIVAFIIVLIDTKTTLFSICVWRVSTRVIWIIVYMFRKKNIDPRKMEFEFILYDVYNSWEKICLLNFYLCD